MKNLLFLVLSTSLLSAQIIPETGDSIYYSPKYCDTSESIEDALDSWSFSGNTQDCFNPSQAMLDALWPLLQIYDSYDCCCKVASTPGLPGAFTGFEGGACESYLDGIGFTSIYENKLHQLNGIYIDMFGRQYTIQPKGFSIMNGNKYIKLGEI